MSEWLSDVQQIISLFSMLILWANSRLTSDNVVTFFCHILTWTNPCLKILLIKIAIQPTQIWTFRAWQHHEIEVPATWAPVCCLWFSPETNNGRHVAAGNQEHVFPVSGNKCIPNIHIRLCNKSNAKCSSTCIASVSCGAHRNLRMRMYTLVHILFVFTTPHVIHFVARRRQSERRRPACELYSLHIDSIQIASFFPWWSSALTFVL